jgi:anaerobic magnesium-protoporphyrin IX monomethyl ester cyclase
MKVTFVYPDQVDVDPTWSGHFHYGTGILSAVLKRAGIETSLIHIIKPNYTDEEFEARLLEERPDLLCYSCTTFAFKLASRLVQVAKRVLPEVPNLVGGLHPTMAPEEVIQTPGFDMLCRGEGEEAILEVCNHLADGTDYSEVQNLWVRKGDTIVRNAVRPVNQNLDAYPFPDRELFDYPTLHHERKGWGTFMMTRGCAYGCTYCANRSLMHLYRGQNYVRFRSIDNLIAEIKEVTARYPFIRNIHFDDDLPFIKKDYTEEFCRQYKKEIGLPFRFNLRPNVTFEEELRKLKDAGCTEAKIGLESGNDYVMNQILARALTVEQVEEAFHTASRAGIKTFSFNMVGLPEETPSAVLDTIKLNARAKPDVMQVSIFFPFPGTPLWDLCNQRGWIPKDTPKDFFTDAMLPLPTMTRAQTLFYHRRFHQLVRLYKWAYRAGDGWVRFLDRTLTFEPTRRVWSFGLRYTLPLYRSVRDKLRARNAPPPEPTEQYVAM